MDPLRDTLFVGTFSAFIREKTRLRNKKNRHTPVNEPQRAVGSCLISPFPSFVKGYRPYAWPYVRTESYPIQG